MSKYNRVLIPIDLTLGRGALSPAVRQIVDTSEAEITLLHVVDSQSRPAGNDRTMRLMTELELFAHRQFREARITRRIEWGRPAESILNAIRAVRADVVLMSAGPAPLAGNALSPGCLPGAGRSGLPGIAGMARHRARESGAYTPRLLRHRIRPR